MKKHGKHHTVKNPGHSVGSDGRHRGGMVGGAKRGLSGHTDGLQHTKAGKAHGGKHSPMKTNAY